MLLAVVKFLLEAGALVSHTTILKETPIYVAAKAGRNFMLLTTQGSFDALEVLLREQYMNIIDQPRDNITTLELEMEMGLEVL